MKKNTEIARANQLVTGQQLKPMYLTVDHKKLHQKTLVQRKSLEKNYGLSLPSLRLYLVYVIEDLFEFLNFKSKKRTKLHII
jgi:hypothetical protein